MSSVLIGLCVCFVRSAAVCAQPASSGNKRYAMTVASTVLQTGNAAGSGDEAAAVSESAGGAAHLLAPQDLPVQIQATHASSS